MDFRSFAAASRDPLLLVEGGRVTHVNAAARRTLGPGASIEEGSDATSIDGLHGAFERWDVAPGVECLRLQPGAVHHARRPSVGTAPPAVGELHLLRAVTGYAGQALTVIDPATQQYVEANEAAGRLWGISREELLARGPEWVWLRTGADAGLVRLRYEELIARSPAVLTQEYRTRRDDESEMYVEFSRRAVRIGDRWLVLAIAHDITPRKQAEAAMKRHVAELSRSNQELEQFAYIASHDLTEPLRMVASYTQLLERRYGPSLEPEAREFMGFIVNGARRMKHLIDDLLLYSRAGRGVPELKAIPLDAALDAALENLAESLGESDACIRRDPLPVIVAERIGMVQLFQNLIGNALKFRGDRTPVVHVGARDDGDAWEFEVRDNGIGIAPAYFEKVFVIFQRLHSAVDYEGTGIGLAICKKIVERHGGRIWVESQPGQGACFRFRLPKNRAASADSASPGPAVSVAHLPVRSPSDAVARD